MMTALDQALAYAGDRGWPVFPVPCDGKKHPLIEWRDFATTDQSLLRVWWRWWPDAWIGCPTGQCTFLVLDVDIKPPVNGFFTLAEFGFDAFLPPTRQVITRSAGLHLHFDAGSHRFGNTAGAKGRGLGPGLDWRADGGFVVLPGGSSGYRWDEEFGIDASLLPVPNELLPKEPQSVHRSKPVNPVSGLSPYAEAALDSACRRIKAAPDGQQEATLNSEAFAIGTLAGANAIPEAFARRTLLWAANQIRTSTRAGHGARPRSSRKSLAPSTTACAIPAEAAMPPRDRAWDADPELRSEAEAERKKHRANGNGPDDPSAAPLAPIDAGDDFDTIIAPRGWLLGNTFCKRFISGLIAQGAGGKTALRIAQALAVATGRELTGEHVFQRGRVLIVCLEDNLDELRRRVRAAVLHHRITVDQVRGWLYYCAPAGLKIAEQQDGSRLMVPGNLEQQVRAFITAKAIDLVILDPLIKTHSADENDNNAIDAVCCILATLAADLDCAIDLLHHERKTGSPEAGDANRGRGASSFRDASRLLYTLTPMTDIEREQFGITKAERRLLIRVDSAKVNIAPPSIEARWFKIIGVPLGNATELYPNGDTVPTVEPWDPPDFWRHLSTFTINTILDQIERGGPKPGQRYSATQQAKGDRAAWSVVKDHCPTLTEKQARIVIATWLDSGMIENRKYDDPIERKERFGAFVIRRSG
jgi:hypothetical protein